MIALENFNKFKPSTITMAQFHSHLSDESDQGDRTIGTNLRMLLNFILTKQMIYPFLTSTWDHTNGCTK